MKWKMTLLLGEVLTTLLTTGLGWLAVEVVRQPSQSLTDWLALAFLLPYIAITIHGRVSLIVRAREDWLTLMAEANHLRFELMLERELTLALARHSQGQKGGEQ